MDGKKVQVMEAGPLEAMTRGEIDIQIATAKQYPRSIDKFQKKALGMATLNADIAGRCFYKLRRGGKTIEGPSVRLAEIGVPAWQNLRAGARVIDIGDQFVTSQGFAHDLETNIAVTMEVRRRITTKDHRRYDEDMIGVTANAANAIAFRNACFKIIPYVYIQELFDQVKRAARGDMKTLTKRIEEMSAKFAQSGVNEKMILRFLSRASTKEIDLQDMEDLIGVYTAIQDGDTTVAEQFGSASKPRTAAPTAREKPAQTEKPEPETRASGEPEKKKLEPIRGPITEKDFVKEVNDQMFVLKEKGLSESQVGTKLVVKGLTGNPFQCQPFERQRVLDVLKEIEADA